MTQHTIGVDIFKAHLTHQTGRRSVASLRRTSANGIFALCAKWLAGRRLARFVFEPTWSISQGFETAFSKTFLLGQSEPLASRRFAEAHGTRAKDDAVDGPDLLARMGAALTLEASSALFHRNPYFRDLHVPRAGLIKDRTRLRNRAQTQDIAL